MDNNSGFQTEVLTRLAVIESKLDRYQEIEKTANEAHQTASNCEKDITEIKENNKWLKRAVITAIISSLAAIFLKIVEKGLGIK